MPITGTNVFRNAELRIGLIANRRLSALGGLLVGFLRKRVRKDTGSTRDSIAYEVSGAGLGTQLKISMTGPNAEWVEYGRKAGKPPLVAALVSWVERHGMPAQAVYPITKAIGKRGIAGQYLIRDLRTHYALSIARAEGAINRDIDKLFSD